MPKKVNASLERVMESIEDLETPTKSDVLDLIFSSMKGLMRESAHVALAMLYVLNLTPGGINPIQGKISFDSVIEQDRIDNLRTG